MLLKPNMEQRFKLLSSELHTWSPSTSRRSMTSEALSRYEVGGRMPILVNAHKRLENDCTSTQQETPSMVTYRPVKLSPGVHCYG